MIWMEQAVDTLDYLSIGTVHGSPSGKKGIALGATQQGGVRRRQPCELDRLAPADRADSVGLERALKGVRDQPASQDICKTVPPGKAAALERDRLAVSRASDAIERQKDGVGEAKILGKNGVYDPVKP